MNIGEKTKQLCSTDVRDISDSADVVNISYQNSFITIRALKTSTDEEIVAFAEERMAKLVSAAWKPNRSPKGNARVIRFNTEVKDDVYILATVVGEFIETFPCKLCGKKWRTSEDFHLYDKLSDGTILCHHHPGTVQEVIRDRNKLLK